MNIYYSFFDTNMTNNYIEKIKTITMKENSKNELSFELNLGQNSDINQLFE